MTERLAECSERCECVRARGGLSGDERHATGFLVLFLCVAQTPEVRAGYARLKPNAARLGLSRALVAGMLHTRQLSR